MKHLDMSIVVIYIETLVLLDRLQSIEMGFRKKSKGEVKDTRERAGRKSNTEGNSKRNYVAKNQINLFLSITFIK